MRSLRLVLALVVIGCLLGVVAARAQGTPEAGESRENPVPIGETAKVGTWTVRVIDYRVDPADPLTTFGGATAQPASGNVFVLYTLEITYTGADAKSASAIGSGSFIDLKGTSELVGTDCDGVNLGDDNFEATYKDLFTGGRTVVTYCAQVTPEQAENLFVYFTGDGDQIFFELDSQREDMGTPQVTPSATPPS